MKYVVLAVLLSAAPALAGYNTNTEPVPKQIVDGGHGAQATARSGAFSSAASQSKASVGNVSGGSVTGGNVTVSNSNGGGTGGGGRGGGDNYLVTTPDGRGMAPCGGGLGLGAVLASFGGTLWEFQDCKIIREAAMLKSWGYHDAAIAELCQIGRVKDAFGGTCPSVGQPAAPPITRTGYRYDYCYTRSPGDKDQHKECENRP